MLNIKRLKKISYFFNLQLVNLVSEDRSLEGISQTRRRLLHLSVSTQKRLYAHPTRSPGALNPEINVVTQCRISVLSHPTPVLSRCA